MVAIEFERHTRLFAQNGQPEPGLRSQDRLRVDPDDSQMWSSATGHAHQIFLFVPAVTVSGVTCPLRVGCHWVAMSGWVVAIEFDRHTRWCVQKGQRAPAAREETTACH